MGIAEIIAAIVAFLAALVPVHSLSYVAPAVAQELSPHATVIFGGDMMFDRSIRQYADDKGGEYLFSCIDPTLRSADLVVANLEGPITDNSSVSEGSRVNSPENYTFTFAPTTAALLAAHNVRVVNIGNNHIENFKVAGVRSTEAYLRAAGVEYFGDPIEQTVAATNARGVTLAFVNYDQFALSSNASTTVAQIQAARAAGEVPIVYTHWGDEYLPATELERSLAHRFVDAGAALVLGSHPHIVQENEVYRGVEIYYSLGNFIFDQYWNDAVSHGLLLSVRFGQSGVEHIDEIPVVLGRDRRTCPLTVS